MRRAGGAIEEPERTDLLDRIRRSSVRIDPIPTGVAPRLTPLSGVSVVLFDVYGTLFVSGSGDVGSSISRRRTDHFRDALSEVALGSVSVAVASAAMESYFALIDSDHAAARSAGVNHPEIDAAAVWTRLLSDHASSLGLESVDDVAARRAAVEYEVRANPVWPMPRVGEVLRSFRRSRASMGIVSNAQFYTPLLFEALLDASTGDLGFEEELISWSFRAGVAKPSLRVFEPILRKLRESRGVEPENVLYVGNDMLNDVYTAHRSGCRTCLFAGDRRSLRLRNDRAECATLVPDVVVTDLRQLYLCVPGVRGDE